MLACMTYCGGVDLRLGCSTCLPILGFPKVFLPVPSVLIIANAAGCSGDEEQAGDG